MIKKVISFIVLFLILLNIPEIVLIVLENNIISSPISYLTFVFLGFLIFLNKNEYPKEVIILSIVANLYFFISSFQYKGDFIILISVYIKFMLYLFGIYIALRNIDQKTIIILLLFGAITIPLDSLYFRFNDTIGDGYVSEFGRYSGFYLNPNVAAVICLVGCALTIANENRWKILTIVFTIFGFLTLSRAFIISWLLLIFIHLYHHRKGLLNIAFLLIMSLFILNTFSEKLNLDADRFRFLIDLFSGTVDTKVLTTHGRADTWSIFYNSILDAPIVGNGFYTFTENINAQSYVGVHNTLLLIFGESGFLPFLLMLYLLFSLIKTSYNLRKKNHVPLLLVSIMIIQILVSHNFFDKAFIVFIFLNIILLTNQYNSKTI